MALTIVEADTESGEVVRLLGEYATYADAYAFVQTSFGPWMPEHDIRRPGFFPYPTGTHAIIIAAPPCDDCDCQ